MIRVSWIQGSADGKGMRAVVVIFVLYARQIQCAVDRIPGVAARSSLSIGEISRRWKRTGEG